MSSFQGTEQSAQNQIVHNTGRILYHIHNSGFPDACWFRQSLATTIGSSISLPSLAQLRNVTLVNYSSQIPLLQLPESLTHSLEVEGF